MTYYEEYMSVLREHMDFNDRNTRKTIINLDEADQNQLLAALTSKLYDKIVEKVDDIDFGTIPRSRGDITKIENYASLCECIDILRSIVIEYKEDTYPIDVVSSAIENLKQRKAIFTKAYTLNVEMPIVLYNTIALAIVSSVSFLISGCIEYIKNPGAETFTIALDKVGYAKTAQNLLFENLSDFNKACNSGQIDLAMDDVIKNNRKMNECGELFDHDYIPPQCDGPECYDNNVPPVYDGDDYDNPQVHHDVPPDAFEREPINDECDSRRIYEFGVAGAIAAGTAIIAGSAVVGKAIITIGKVIIPLLRNLVYYFYHSKQNVSDYLAIQSELIQMNAYKVQYSTTMEDDKRKAVYKKQMKLADSLKKWSNRFDIDYQKSKKAADKLQKEEHKKLKSEDLGIAPPIDMQGSSLF